MPHKEDTVRLRHMLDAADDAVSFVKGKNRKSLETDKMLRLSLVKCIEIIGEAASKLSKESRAELSHVPWENIVNMRNRLIHAYYDINLDTVWSTVTDDLPPLISILKKIVSSAE